MELVEFLRQRLDEDEQSARRAADVYDGEWTYDDGDYGPRVIINPRDPSSVWEREGASSVWRCDDPEDGCYELSAACRAEGDHIARHDPARVLREVESKRRILDQHEAMRAGAEAAAGTILAGAAKVRLGAYKFALKCLALPYDSHPDYRQEWKP